MSIKYQSIKINSVPFLPQVLQDIIISYFTGEDLKISGLLTNIDEIEWHERVKLDFGHIIRNKYCKGIFKSWFHFYCHLEYITHSKATIIKIDEHFPEAIFGKEGYIACRDWKKKLSSKIYELIKDLKEGDIVITPQYYLIVRSRGQRRWLSLKRNVDKSQSIHNFLTITSFPINYWKHSNIPHLSYSLVRIKANVEQHMYYFIGTIFTWIRIFVIDNVAYAIISSAEDQYRGYTRRIKHYKFKVRTILNYPYTFENACIAKVKNGPFEVELPNLLKSYNLSWDRVLLHNY